MQGIFGIAAAKLAREEIISQGFPWSMLDVVEEYVDIIECIKSKPSLTQLFFLKYFPMAIENAVGASRTISTLIIESASKSGMDEIVQNKLYHKYDTGRSNIDQAKELAKKTTDLTNLWLQTLKPIPLTYEQIEGALVYLANDWYSVDVSGESTSEHFLYVSSE